MEVQIYIHICYTALNRKGAGIYYIVTEYKNPDGTISIVEACEGLKNTTKLRTVLIACITALSRMKKVCPVKIHINDRYLAELMNQGVYYKWNFESWTHEDKPIENADLWKQLFRYLEKYKTKFILAEMNPYTAYMDSHLKNTEIIYRVDMKAVRR